MLSLFHITIAKYFYKSFFAHDSSTLSNELILLCRNVCGNYRDVVVAEIHFVCMLGVQNCIGGHCSLQILTGILFVGTQSLHFSI